MCGIAGTIGMNMTEDICARMLETMRHRGPDGSGTYCHKECTLMHARLAIIDPEGGQQPMVLDWAGIHYVLVYNGELYNTQEVRRELHRLGHEFRGHSDTEVVLHGYAQWGEACLDRFNGIFAFAVWEEQTGNLFFARDRIGVKPLFYIEHRSGLMFASELKTILVHPAVEPVLDREGAAQILLLGPGRTPGSGVFKGIQELEPGCCGYVKNGRVHIRRYWKLMDREHRESFEETVECVRYLVEDAIIRQMVSDVPIGTFLSGGLDSSLITAICAREMNAGGEQLHTFSLDFEGNDQNFIPGKFQPNSDKSFIHMMEQEIKTVHHWTVLNSEGLMDAMENATLARDLPGMADVDFSLLSFCREIRSHVKVALSGECADEIFGGYPWYRDPEIRDSEGFPWAQNTQQRYRLLAQPLREKLQPSEYLYDKYRQTCLESDILPGTAGQERRMKEMVNLNFRWFMQTLLDRKDRMSMFNGLEVRVPFCDYRIAEYLYGVPWEFKDHRGAEKGLLRTAMEGLLPQEVLWRKKSPYPKTFDPKYRTLVAAKLEERIQDAHAAVWQLVDRETARELLTSEYRWPWYGQLMRGPQTMAYILQIDYWLRHYGVKLAF